MYYLVALASLRRPPAARVDPNSKIWSTLGFKSSLDFVLRTLTLDWTKLFEKKFKTLPSVSLKNFYTFIVGVRSTLSARFGAGSGTLTLSTQPTAGSTKLLLARCPPHFPLSAQLRYLKKTARFDRAEKPKNVTLKVLSTFSKVAGFIGAEPLWRRRPSMRLCALTGYIIKI